MIWDEALSSAGLSVFISVYRWFVLSQIEWGIVSRRWFRMGDWIFRIFGI